MNDERFSPVIPGLRYQDAPKMIDWLCTHFGFERHLVVPADDGRIAHAQLRWGSGLVMVGSIFDSVVGRYMVQPGEVGGRETQAVYLVCDDADALHDRAVAGGATILVPLEDASYGGRGFSCRDPEGHVWHFGTYRP
jgi:uncharacterized glyoxalase superfamily protein PhnB